MLNKEPVIVNGSSRGGTNILMNMILSHPKMAMPSGELNKVFKGGGMGDGFVRKQFKKTMYDLPIRILSGDLFNRYSYINVDCKSNVAKKYIDFVLFVEKMMANHESHNKWKTEGVHYSKKELSLSRLVVKAHDDLLILNNMFREMYDDVKFVSIVRNGYALCESLMRRGWTAESAAKHYNFLANRILQENKNKDFLLVKFEDVLNNPKKIINSIYCHLKLDLEEVKKFRFQHKAIATKNSSKSINYGDYDRQVVWLDKKNIEFFFRKDVNHNQINRLSNDDKNIIKVEIDDVMKKLDYI
jgi:hypothetical protein